MRDGAVASDLWALSERALLREIVSRYPGKTTTGSALLGVTAPTFRRRLAQLRSADAAGDDH